MWLSIIITCRVSILLCDSRGCSVRALTILESIATSALLRLDRAEVIAWSMMTTPTIISVVDARKWLLLLHELALTSFWRTEAIWKLRLAGARAFSRDNTVRFFMTLVAHYETARVDLTSLRRLHQFVISLLVLLVYLNGGLYLRSQLGVEVIEGRVCVFASLCLRQRWLLLNNHRVNCLICRSGLVSRCGWHRICAQYLLIVEVERVLTFSTCLCVVSLFWSLLT